jgi:hypothetical protein
VKLHRWVVVATYELTDKEARASVSAGEAQVLLGDQNILSIDGPGCLDCEEVFGQAPRYCSADAFVVIPLREKANVRFGPAPEGGAR